MIGATMTATAAEQNQLAEAGGNAAQQRADREPGDTDEEIAFAAEYPAERSGDRQHDAVGDEIGGERPGRFVITGGEAARDVGQADVHDCRIEDLHERSHGHHDCDQPAAMRRLPGLMVVVGIRIAHALELGPRRGYVGFPR
jgi:hypothetical protein